ncbi:hypothetical protein WH87_12960 [Devosia epidermidihirudinis]|uniref:HTH gntR-type domain-containing protein n=1 Tax=Devosia epidermidihirudinis TaxID=1293439 RepID=A0A0F5Q9I6_9HYPH|nr:GntR family transcriptional regulator [Devosia epidermidihirudinis]KKC37428.1 hypothetical protein WH87_12960 [Devosia epidermidihirudinis]
MIKGVVRNSPLPLYQQVKKNLLDLMRSGEIPSSGKIASERELVAQLGVSRITVRQALKELVADGQLQSRPGKGFYTTARSGRGHELEVVRSFSEMALANGSVPGTKLLSLDVMEPPEDIALGLALEPGAKVVHLKRLRLLDDLAVSVTQDWLPATLVPTLAMLEWNKSNLSLYAELRERYAVIPLHGQTRLSAALAEPDEAELLGLTPPAAVLVVDQIAYGAGRIPINMTHSVQNPKTYPLRLSQGTASFAQ